MQTESTTYYQKTKGIKITIADLSAGESAVFPRTSYSTIRASISVLRIERPEKEFHVDIIENGIKVTCLK